VEKHVIEVGNNKGTMKNHVVQVGDIKGAMEDAYFVISKLGK
jgi:hypothetical protein